MKKRTIWALDTLRGRSALFDRSRLLHAGQGGFFQASVGTQPAPGVAGMPASLNPMFSVDAGPFGLVAGSLGLVVGRFAWISYIGLDGDNAPAIAQNQPPGYGSISANPAVGTGGPAPAGFVFRNQQGLNTTYLSDAGNTIKPGFACALASGTDFWALNDDPTVQALPGATVYADFATGKIQFSALTASATGTIAAESSSFTGSCHRQSAYRFSGYLPRLFLARSFRVRACRPTRKLFRNCCLWLLAKLCSVLVVICSTYRNCPSHRK